MMFDRHPLTDAPLRIPLRYRAMTTPKPNKHELRTKETRELLLRAAEEIFVRDLTGSESGPGQLGRRNERKV